VSPATLEQGAPDTAFTLELERCEQLLGDHLEAARRCYGSAALGVIDLPSLRSGALVPEQIRVCAVLYWVSQLERAGLLRFIEALSQGVVRGSITIPLGRAVHELARLWRSRERSFSKVEREALFKRVFGEEGGPFAVAFRDLIAALVALGRSPLDQGTTHLIARIAVAARQVGGHLSESGTGIAAFAARDIVAQVRSALRILRDPDVVRGFGGGSPWLIVSRHAPQILGGAVSPQPHLSRATAGFGVIDWVASHAGSIETGAVRLDRSAAVIRHAEAWSAVHGEG
jgi:hypothetical protein